jgi:hypothetical protein
MLFLYSVTITEVVIHFSFIFLIYFDNLSKKILYEFEKFEKL